MEPGRGWPYLGVPASGLPKPLEIIAAVLDHLPLSEFHAVEWTGRCAMLPCLKLVAPV